MCHENHTVHWQGVHGQVKMKFFKVRELSGNFDISQGILHFQPKVREKSENFERRVYELQKITRIMA